MSISGITLTCCLSVRCLAQSCHSAKARVRLILYEQEEKRQGDTCHVPVGNGLLIPKEKGKVNYGCRGDVKANDPK